MGKRQYQAQEKNEWITLAKNLYQEGYNQRKAAGKIAKERGAHLNTVYRHIDSVFPHRGYETSFNIIGERWTSLIIQDLLNGTRRFRELLAIGINDKVLSERLKRMEKYGLVNREIYGEVPVRVEYSLTEKGRTLEPIIRAMENWDKEREDKSSARPVRSSEDSISRHQT